MGSRGSYISKILYVETKESGPSGAGGVRRARPLDPPMVMLHFNPGWELSLAVI